MRVPLYIYLYMVCNGQPENHIDDIYLQYPRDKSGHPPHPHLQRCPPRRRFCAPQGFLRELRHIARPQRLEQLDSSRTPVANGDPPFFEAQ